MLLLRRRTETQAHTQRIANNRNNIFHLSRFVRLRYASFSFTPNQRWTPLPLLLYVCVCAVCVVTLLSSYILVACNKFTVFATVETDANTRLLFYLRDNDNFRSCDIRIAEMYSFSSIHFWHGATNDVSTTLFCCVAFLAIVLIPASVLCVAAVALCRRSIGYHRFLLTT